MKCINIIIHKKKSLLKLHTIVYYAFECQESVENFSFPSNISLEFVSIHTKNSPTFSSLLSVARMKCINIIIHKKKSLLKFHTIIYYAFISYKYSSIRLKFQPKVLIALNVKTKNEINWMSRERVWENFSFPNNLFSWICIYTHQK